ncbi:hypothetical protein ACET3Z_021575 [Daucus carota]
MEYMWDLPGPDYVKINIHCEVSANPSPLVENELEHIHIETTNVGIFELISAQHQFVIPLELLESFRLFNFIHANQSPENVIPRKISWIPDHMNSAAIYMAEHGMLHLTDLVELRGDATLGNLRFFLDRDLGRVLHNPEVVILPDLGLGEIMDSPPPSGPPKQSGPVCIHGNFSNVPKLMTLGSSKRNFDDLSAPISSGKTTPSALVNGFC